MILEAEFADPIYADSKNDTLSPVSLSPEAFQQITPCVFLPGAVRLVREQAFSFFIIPRTREDRMACSRSFFLRCGPIDVNAEEVRENAGESA